MLGRPFRFLQASDFHLEQPPYGLAEVPDHLVEVLADAPYRAAARVFDAALAEDVDFFLLAGNLVHPNRAGPRGLAFLNEQFSRLAERGIAVYWATGETDCRRQWPSAMAWPQNVHLFPGHRVERLIHSRRGEPLCQIAGYSSDDCSAIGVTETPAVFLDEFAGAADDLFTIALVPHELDPTALAELPVRYWALGGVPNCSTSLNLASPQRTAHAAGSPQGRSPAETGPHGCALVNVDEASQFRIVPLATDSVRWHHERFAITADTQRGDLDHLLHERLTALAAATADRTLLIRWTIAGEGPLFAHARRSGLAAELTASLRVDFGFRAPAVWTTSVDIEPPALPDEWFQQETLLGDFLRGARSLELSPSEPLNLRAYLSERQWAGALADCGTIVEPAARRSVLRQAALLGADLLRPDDGAAKEPAR